MPAWKPSPRYERFDVYRNPDGTCFINVVSGDGGYVFAKDMNEDEAWWTAALLNAAIGFGIPE